MLRNFPEKLIIFLAFLFLSASNYAAPDLQLKNNLGNGNPKLHLELAPTNGPGWKSFSIDYQATGNIPSSTDIKKDWSPWNIKDEAGRYYGTITLHSNGSAAWKGEYVASNDGVSIKNITLSSQGALWVLSGVVENQLGPFPETPIATPAVDAKNNRIIKLSVNGKNIVNDQGKVIVLKGVVRPSLEWNPQGEKLSEQDIKNMRAWGANVIRLDLNQNYWFASLPKTSPGSYKQIIDAIIYHAAKQNMAVILDLHWTENGHQSPMANKKSLQFWKEIASEYKNFGTVIFELFNEPYNVDKTVWLNGDATFAGYQELYNAVRSTGAENICIVNGLSWGYDLSFINDNFKLTGTNIVYGSHPYNRTTFGQNFAYVADKFPLIFTEFGVNQSQYFPNGYQSVYRAVLETANQLQASYTGFAWWVEGDANNANVFPDLIKDWSGTPLNGGVIVHDDMQAHPGTDI